jgi:hypothetical protein
MPFPPEPGKKFLVTGMPRSGTTLAWQIANELLPGEVMHSHCYISEKYKEYLAHMNMACKPFGEVNELPTILTVRDPFDAYLSYEWVYRHKDDWKEPKYVDRMTNFLINHFINGLAYFYSSVVGGRKVLILKYECFDNNDISEKVALIASFLNVLVTDERILEISEKFSLEANKTRANMFKDFEEYCDKTFVHGDHISPGNGRSGSGKKSIPAFVMAKFLQNEWRWFHVFGYDEYYDEDFLDNKAEAHPELGSVMAQIRRDIFLLSKGKI